MRRMKYIEICMLLVVSALTSCVRDEIEPCPPLQVNIAVKDKNYFNVDKVEQEKRLSDDLAFREYIPTLYYTLRDASTGKVVEEQGVFEVRGDARTFPITFCDCIPHGKYVLTVWGGLEDLKALSEDRTSVSFHPGKTEGRDVYMTNDTLVYDAWNNNHTVEMERTKGKLIVQTVNLTDEVTIMEENVSEVYGRVDTKFRYSEKASVYEWHTLEISAEENVTKTLLAPSIRKDGTVLRLGFYEDQTTEIPLMKPKDVNITMNRNELTVLKYVYEGNNKFTIYILVNDNWEILHGLIID